MWKFNPFNSPREPTSLEGRYVDVGNVKIYVRNPIADGGFSCVYLARDAVNTSKQYALKHIICNDEELLDLVMKEVSVMNTLKGHPNVVTLIAHTTLDMGRTKEALLLLEFCEKSLVTVLEKRGAAYFEEKQILLIFRDICNAVSAMHCQSPPIAHRDVKAENILLGPEGAWKLCDFGSTTTNHKCFDRPEEMGVEEDNIRKHTTPAYRAPEMWDLYRKEVISEKVDIWALGCLLYRICYLKSAFDGESKLQILNGNYRIPEAPKYNPFMAQLIRDMLEASPDARPDITQVLFRVNEQLPIESQKQLPDGPATAVNMHPNTPKTQYEGVGNKINSMAQRNPPLTSPREQIQSISPPSQGVQKTGGISGGPIGAFWASPHAQDKDGMSLTNKESARKDPLKMPGCNYSQAQPAMNKATSQNESVNTFVADFKSSRLNVGNANDGRSEEQEAEVNNLKEQLKRANLEKAEITSKYEKLCAICRSQRQELQELKRSLATGTTSPQPHRESSKSQSSPSLQTLSPREEKIDGGILELQQAMFASHCLSPRPSPHAWQAFPDDPKSQPASNVNQPGLMRPPNGHQSITKPSVPIPKNPWSRQDIVLLSPSPSSPMPRSLSQGNVSQMLASFDATKSGTDPPPGWAGF